MKYKNHKIRIKSYKTINNDRYYVGSYFVRSFLWFGRWVTPAYSKEGTFIWTIEAAVDIVKKAIDKKEMLR